MDSSPKPAQTSTSLESQRRAPEPSVVYTLTLKGDELTLTARPCGLYARSAPPIIPDRVLARMDKAAKALLGAKVQRRKLSDSDYVYRKPQSSDWVNL